MSYLDLQELADELTELRATLFTCPLCKGEGTIEIENDPPAEPGEPEALTGDEPCDECDGDGEITYDDDTLLLSLLPGEDRERLDMLIELEVELGNDLDSVVREESTAIPERDFEDYARELARDIGAISGEENWPLSCIDWEQAAKELRYDYTGFTFDGTDYLVRSY